MQQIGQALQSLTLGSQTTEIEPCEHCRRTSGHHAMCPESQRQREAAERFGRIVDGVAECGLPEAYVTGARSFETFEAGRHQSIDAALAAAKAWAAGEGADWLFMTSAEPGLGKTHLAASAIAAMIRRGAAGRFVKFGPMLREMVAAPLDQKLAVFRKYSRPKVLGLDEIGAEKASEFTVSTLSELIDERYELNRRTCLTSNLTLDELASKFAPGGEETAAKRIVDRIYHRTGGKEGKGRLKLEGRSWRKG